MLHRDMTQFLSRALGSMPVVALTGMRQVGKSTLLQHDPAVGGRRYATLDDFASLEAARRDPDLHPRAAAQPVAPDELLLGGMPPVCLRQAGDPAIWFQGYVQTYLERDVRALAQVADLLAFRRLLQLAALRTGQILNVSDL